jgi:AhpD family alkylhydroperoxidase
MTVAQSELRRSIHSLVGSTRSNSKLQSQFCHFEGAKRLRNPVVMNKKGLSQALLEALSLLLGTRIETRLRMKIETPLDRLRLVKQRNRRFEILGRPGPFSWASMTGYRRAKRQPRIDYRDMPAGAIKAMRTVQQYVDECGLEHKLLELIKLRASQINGCAFCIDMHAKDARAIGESKQRLYGLSAWREAPYYSDRERAAALVLGGGGDLGSPRPRAGRSVRTSTATFR